MIKIISGKYKGRKLFNVPNIYLRPTQAIVRKSMMQILEPFEGMSVLDLYSGVGTLGIEALSRGAKKISFVESNFSAVKVLEKNIESICFDDDIEIFPYDVTHFFKSNFAKYDIIIADPPYALIDYRSLKKKVLPFLNKGGIFCMEMKRSKIEDDSVRVKNYGSTQVVFWRCNI